MEERSAVRRITPAVLIALAASHAAGDTLSFEGLAHGQIITPSMFAQSNVAIEAVNFQLPGAMPIAFDTLQISSADPDLNGPPWARGNLPTDTVLGNVLIIPENLTDADNDGIVDNPDDEGARPAGDLTFRFAQPVVSFGFDVLDIEGIVQERTTISFFTGDTLAGTLDFAELTTPGSLHYDPTIDFGNNSLNRIQPVLADTFSTSGFSKVVIHLGGSGAFDNIVTAVPAPTSGALLILTSLVASRRRR
ncbi:MAG: hypothetical protein ACTS22_09990 [Phycisphaerales bacterium]